MLISSFKVALNKLELNIRNNKRNINNLQTVREKLLIFRVLMITSKGKNKKIVNLLRR